MNMVLFVREVQSNIFYWVELQISVIGEVIIVGVMFVGWVIGCLEFIVIYIDYIVDVCLIVQMVSWVGSDVVVLIFVVIVCIVSMIFFGVGEGIDYVQWVVVLFIMIFQVKIVYFICYVLCVVLSVIIGNGRSSSYCSICGKSQNSGQC